MFFLFLKIILIQEKRSTNKIMTLDVYSVAPVFFRVIDSTKFRSPTSTHKRTPTFSKAWLSVSSVFSSLSSLSAPRNETFCNSKSSLTSSQACKCWPSSKSLQKFNASNQYIFLPSRTISFFNECDTHNSPRPICSDNPFSDICRSRP